MLSCRRAFRQLSKVTRQSQVNQSCRPLKYVGIISINKLWYGHSSSDKKTHRELGTTIKLKESIPQSKYVNSKERPACESQPYASCPPSCIEECGGRPPCDPSRRDNQFPNWKHILATLIIAGVTISVMHYNGVMNNNDKSKLEKKDAGKKRRRPREVIKNPVASKSIPPEVPYLLIGGGTAAFSAFRSIKSRDPKAKVLVITEEEDLPYMRPPLSKELWYNTDRATSAKLNFKQWNGTQRSLFYEPREFYTNVTDLMQSDKGGVAVARGWKVTKLDVMNRIATLDDGYEISYDKCLIATGASPKTHPVLTSAPNEVKDKVITFRTKEDFLELEENVHDPQCKNIVIVGGGFLGSELACSLAQNLDKDKKIYQIYKEKHIMAQILPEYLSEWTTKKAEMEGVNCIPNVEIENFIYEKGKLSLVVTGGKILDADQVVVAIGVEPNTELATHSRLEVEPKIGGFLVNAELEARSNLWVAGDASCFYDIRLGRRRVEHHDHAVISGRLAGENMTGAGKPYLHQSMFWSDLGPEVGYEAIGIIDSSLPTVGVFAKPTQAEAKIEEVAQTANKSLDESTGKAAEEKLEKAAQTANKSLDDSTEKKVTLTQKDYTKSQNPDNKNASSDTTPTQEEKLVEYGKGVIFYLRDDIVVGIVLWNIFNRMSIARQVLARGTKYEELNEVAKLFTVHDD